MSDKWFDIFPAASGAKTTRVSIYDSIGDFGVSARDFVNAFNAIKTPKIDLRISSDGGEILEGFACYNAIKDHPSDVAVSIDFAASIASVIALAGDSIHIAKNGFMMVHNGSARVVGDPDDLRKQADVLDKMNGVIADAYSAKTGRPVTEVKAAMNAVTWFTAAEAKAWGLVDEVDGDEDANNLAVSALHAVAKYQKVPPKLRKFAARAVINSEKEKGNHMDKLVFREGKWFLGEAEVDAQAALDAGKASITIPAAPDMTAAVAKAHDEGVKAERDYRSMFGTVVKTAGLDATAAAEFETQFYGRNETDLKFLASHAIGQRSKPVGESNPGNGEGQQATAEDKINQAAAKRFAEEPHVRKMFGLRESYGSDEPQYKAALTRYQARERQWAKDQEKHGTSVAK